MTDDEIRGWLSDGTSRGIHINSKTLNAICTAALDARAKLPAQPALSARVVELEAERDAIERSFMDASDAYSQEISALPAAQPAPVTVEEAARVLLDACPNPIFDQLKPLMMGEIVERFVGQNEDGEEESYTRSVSWDTMKQVIRFALRALAGDKP